MSTRLHWILAGAVLVTQLCGCECNEEFEQLTLGISLSNDGTDVRGITTPKWNRVWEQPEDKLLVGVATYGPADREPTDDTFELYDVTDTPRLMPYEPRGCEESSTDNIGSCQTTEGDQCYSRAKDWIQVEPFTQGRRYALVHRMETGNGKPLNTDDKPVVFEGILSLVMEIEVTEPLDPNADVDMSGVDMP